MSLWEQIKKIFQSVEDSENKSYQPVVKSAIKRSVEEQVDFDQWKKTLSKRRLIDWVNAAYVNYLVDPKSVDTALDFLSMRASRGFVVHFHKTQYPIRDVIHFFDYLKERVLTLGYRTYTSDSRTYNRSNFVEAIQRHYLKPSINFGRAQGEKVNQRFGNITIEVLLRNDKVYNLKFSATAYSDHKYEEADEFGDLMKELMN